MSFEKILGDIEHQLEEDLVTLAEIEKQAAGMRERVNRLSKARRDLSGESQSKAKPKSKAKRAQADGTPTPESTQAVLTVLSEAGEPLPIKEIQKRAGRSHSNVDATVRYLRAHELIRLAGKRGTAFVYALMESKPVLKEAESAANAA